LANSGAGPTELAICILLDFFEVYQEASDLPVNFSAFREAFIAPADRGAERLEIDAARSLPGWPPSAAG
jgi:hypothetical protein